MAITVAGFPGIMGQLFSWKTRFTNQSIMFLQGRLSVSFVFIVAKREYIFSSNKHGMSALYGMKTDVR